MTIAFVLGNGISRQSVSLQALSEQGKIYGCNALYREFTPEVLVSTDRPIATYIQESGYSMNNRFYTRRPIAGLGAVQVPTPYYGYSSGPIAVSIAASDGNQRVYLVGFDMGPTIENRFNNLYAGTEFYKAQGANPTFTGNWVKQMIRVITDNKLTNFIRVCGETTAVITEFDSLANLFHMDLVTFQTCINSKKDL